MPVTTASRHSPSSPWNAELQPFSHVNVSTSPAGFPARTPSISHAHSLPFLCKTSSSPDLAAAPRSLSPSYFGIVVENSSNPPDSNPGPYTQKNWDYFSQARSSDAGSTPLALTLSSGLEIHSTPRLHGSGDISDLRKANSFFSSEVVLGRRDGGDSAVSPRTLHFPAKPPTRLAEENQMEVDDANFFPEDKVRKSQNYENTASLSLPLELPRTHSPESLRTPSYPSPLSFPIANARVRDKSRSLPLQAAQNSLSASGFRSPRRADTLPAAVDHNVGFVSVEHCAERLQSASDRVLLLDVRPYPQFCQANITGSLNLCIPTTLLKRPSFNTQKLEDTFVGESEKRKFATWKESTHIIAYDFNTAHLRDAASLMHILKKFTVEGWNGKALILRGGFSAFASQFPDQIRRQQQAAGPTGVNAAEPPCKNLTLPSAALIAGGCILPDAAVANPFFGNIRQNMDLLDGVGQLALSLPEGLTEFKRDRLPSWLRLASESEDKGHVVSDRFLTIEKRELERMREALSSNTAYGSGVRQGPVKFRVAGIEKGSKNRYNDIYPFDHSRVRLQDIPSGGCDYVNANYIKAEHASKSYIATQAPVPDTFTDFWRVVWEQDIRVIVALTAEVERGLVKCHRYWNSGDYGPFKLKALAERRVPMDSSKSHQNSLPSKRPKPLKRRATDPPTIGEKPAAQASDPTGETPYITIRHFTLSHSAFPFQPIREITQLQYSYWPDLGTTSQPVHLVKLIDQCNRIAKASVNSSSGHQDARPERQRPTLVHCSAGCGRTGTFCTVDSVMDTLKRWQAERRVRFQRGINGDRQKNTPGWIYDDNVDLVAKTVEDFRTQRPSMVQNLTQFVLCYESVLAWLVSQMDDVSL